MPEADDAWVDSYYKALGRLINGARTSASMTQDALARYAGLTRSSITNLEAGRQRIQVHTLLLIAEALKVAPEHLLPKVNDQNEILFSDLEQQLEGQSAVTRDFVFDALKSLPGKEH